MKFQSMGRWLHEHSVNLQPTQLYMDTTTLCEKEQQNGKSNLIPNAFRVSNFSSIFFYIVWIRIAWISIVVTATVAAAVLLYISYALYKETPTITVIESLHYPSSNVLFPAVTICSMNSISAKKALNLAQSMTRPNDTTPEQLSKLFALVLHFDGVGQAPPEDYERLHKILQSNKMNVANLTSALKPSCNDMLVNCKWKGTSARCMHGL